ncbi:triacylglycerol lipase [Aquabacterium sp. CECT 9606]|uniref:lipase family alpha/beta hydrolase n=1 Tax=Aquabacterium sp. CECT 9606 TaxID=2845822 RepID=UPI001E431F38|nr:triacylglycerol lipase [Aquabacterium sp. CECT 9606]CAH0350802.1 Triacylglycerol lipase [Aquabacterium sp. CECT 9606]
MHKPLSALLSAAAIALTVATGLLPLSSAQAATASTTAQTKYPIVLVHGFMGFKDILGVDYFYQVPADLRKNGATVYVAAVSQVNSSELRGEQLLQQMRAWAARDGIKKFNLIGHSQGGPTARYVAGVAPELVASITTVASPARMTVEDGNNPVNDLITNYSKLTTFLGSFVAWVSGNSQLPQDVEAAKDFAKEVNAFATRFPAGVPSTYCGLDGKEFEAGMYFYSITGNKPKTNAWDLSDLAMVESSVPSDGTLPVCSTHFGKVLRDDYPWNHIDEMNHIFGLLGKGAPDPVAFYRTQANRLKLKGL